MDSLDRFLNRFDFKKRDYSVYVAIDKQAFSFREILEKKIGVIFDVDIDNSDLKYDRSRYDVVNIQLNAFDERTAASEAYKRISLFFRYYDFLGERRFNWLFNVGKVIDEIGHVAFVNLYSRGLDCLTDTEQDSDGKLSATLISALLANARNSFTCIDLAVNMHDVAIKEDNLRNGFLNLWSVFEILFVSDQTESKSAEIERKVLPILQRDYLHYIIGELEKNLKQNLPKSTVNDIIKKVDEEERDDWLCRLLFLPSYDILRKEVYGDLKDYALLRSRMSQISNDYAEKKNILNDVEGFKKRISWHFKRLYRTRNTIVHAGENPSNLKELGEHLHSYIDECLLEIMLLLVNNEQLHTIENVMIDIQLREDSIMRCLRQKGKLDESSILILFK